jgi:hypothetical protein
LRAAITRLELRGIPGRWGEVDAVADALAVTA